MGDDQTWGEVMTHTKLRLIGTLTEQVKYQFEAVYTKSINQLQINCPYWSGNLNYSVQ